MPPAPVQSWPPPGVPLGRPERPLITEVGERVDARRADEIDVRALAAVAAVRPAKGHELLAAKAHGATPAVAGLDCDDCFVDESHELNERAGE